MPFDSYADLQLTIATWMARPGDPIITANVTDMIALFEEEARDRLKTRFNETLATLLASINSPIVPLPSDFWEEREIKIPGQPQWTGTGSISGGLMNVDAITTGTVIAGGLIWGNGISDTGTFVQSFGTGTGGVGTYILSNPLNSIETVISGTNTDTPVQVLRYVTPEQMDTFADNTVNGLPERYTIVAQNIILDPTPDLPYTLLMDYMQGIPALSASNPSNWLLAKYPSTYLFGSLMMGEALIGRDERIPIWEQGKEAAFQRILDSDKHARFPGGTLQIKTDTGNP